MSIKKLKLRWGEYNNDLIKLLSNKVDMRTVICKFSKVNGLSDYRGIEVKKIFIRDNFFFNIDFSFSDFSGTHFENCIFNNCIFKKTNFTNVIDGSNIFTDVLFEDCNFTEAGLGYEGSQYGNVGFVRVRFNKTFFIRPEFNNTSFKNCILNNIDFNASSFVDCYFEGDLYGCWFRGGFASDKDIKRYGFPKKNKMINVSFEKAKLRMVDFSHNCDLSSVIPPKGVNYRKYDLWNERLGFLKKEYSNWEGDLKKEAEIFYNIYSRFSENQKWFIINILDAVNKDKLDIANKIITILDKYK